MLAPRMWEGGGGVAICYIISGGWLVKLLYNVIWGRVCVKNDIFLFCGRPLRHSTIQSPSVKLRLNLSVSLVYVELVSDQPSSISGLFTAMCATATVGLRRRGLWSKNKLTELPETLLQNSKLYCHPSISC